MRRYRHLSACFVWSLAAACDGDGGKSPPSPTSSAPSSLEEVPTVDDEPVETVDDTPESDHADACAPRDPALKAMQLLRLTPASAIEGKDPKDKLHTARAGQRVYAHLRMRNRSKRERCLRIRFRVNDEPRTEVTLKVGRSWSWRTWAYATLRDDDRGRLAIEVVDDQDVTLAERTLPIVN